MTYKGSHKIPAKGDTEMRWKDGRYLPRETQKCDGKTAAEVTMLKIEEK